jgi:hypothetical protein
MAAKRVVVTLLVSSAAAIGLALLSAVTGFVGCISDRVFVLLVEPDDRGRTVR